MALSKPKVLVAELTYRCPLRCAYCSNPVPVPKQDELSTEGWLGVVEQAKALGVQQIHFTGGEPMLRGDVERIVAHSSSCGLYPTLVTSGLHGGSTSALLGRIDRMAQSGLRALQVSFQDVDPSAATAIAGRDALQSKLAVARRARQLGVSLTFNVVLHAKNLSRLQSFIDLAVDLCADRVELAHVQYHGWAAVNRAALIPSLEQIQEARKTIAAAKLRHSARIDILTVMADLHADRVKSCMGGLGTTALVVQPGGAVLPCHGAACWPLEVENVRSRSLSDIWFHGKGFTRFRNLDWMQSPCSNCPERFRDHGGCRCQALAWTGDLHATDPACPRSPHHVSVRRLRRQVTSEALIRLRHSKAEP